MFTGIIAIPLPARTLSVRSDAMHGKDRESTAGQIEGRLLDGIAGVVYHGS